MEKAMGSPEDTSIYMAIPMFPHTVFQRPASEISMQNNKGAGPNVSLNLSLARDHLASSSSSSLLWEREQAIRLAQPTQSDSFPNTFNSEHSKLVLPFQRASPNLHFLPTTTTPSERPSLSEESPFVQTHLVDDAHSLALKLGRDEVDNGPDLKRCRGGGGGGGMTSSSSSGLQQQSRCQVDDCDADLSTVKDYHRRHKVCERHAKAGSVFVGRIMQRFCQQCSRFHPLEAFDEDRRSCRKRLAGHNKRRRKAQPGLTQLPTSDPVTSIITMLTQIPAGNNSNATASSTDGVAQRLKAASTFLESLSNKIAAIESSKNEGGGTSATLQVVPPPHTLSQNRPSLEYATENCEGGASSNPLLEPSRQPLESPFYFARSNGQHTRILPMEPGRATDYLEYETNGGQECLNPPQSQSRCLNTQSIERNCTIEIDPPINISQADGLHDGVSRELELPKLKHCGVPQIGFNLGVSLDHGGPHKVSSARERECAGHLHKFSSSCLDDGITACVPEFQLQEQTARIALKFFDRDPGELPPFILKQFLDWLALVPSNMESHVRSGCVILTILLSMSSSAWDKLCKDMVSTLTELVKNENGQFWRSGRILVRVQKETVYIIQGKVYANDFSLHPISSIPRLLLIKPLAVRIGEIVDLEVHASNLDTSKARIICAYQGKHTDKEMSFENEGSRKRERNSTRNQLAIDSERKSCEAQKLSFTVGPFHGPGRCLIEVEQHILGDKIFPVIIAESDICDEIRSLEEEMEKPQAGSEGNEISNMNNEEEEGVLKKSEILHFLHELGWLFQRSQAKKECTFATTEDCISSISPGRLRWVMNYSTDRGWCGLVRKVLDMVFSSGLQPLETLQIGKRADSLLHRAVRGRSKELIKILLEYKPPHLVENLDGCYIFTPDMVDPQGFTPLHIAASMHDAADLVDALTSDPQQVWLYAWTNSRNSFEETPLVSALASGNSAYAQLVHNKAQIILGKNPASDYERISIDTFPHEARNSRKHMNNKEPRLRMGQLLKPSCRDCAYNRSFTNLGSKPGFIHRPFLFSLLAITAVCVCVCLLFKGPPEIMYVKGPFTWETVKFGYI